MTNTLARFGAEPPAPNPVIEFYIQNAYAALCQLRTVTGEEIEGGSAAVSAPAQRRLRDLGRLAHEAQNSLMNVN